MWRTDSPLVHPAVEKYMSPLSLPRGGGCSTIRKTNVKKSISALESRVQQSLQCKENRGVFNFEAEVRVRRRDERRGLQSALPDTKVILLLPELFL